MQPNSQRSDLFSVPAVSMAYVVPQGSRKKRLALIVSPTSVMLPLNNRHTATALEIRTREIPGIEEFKPDRKNQYNIRWIGDPNLLATDPEQAIKDLRTPWRQAYISETKALSGPVFGDEIPAKQLLSLLERLSAREGLNAYKEESGVKSLLHILSCRINPFARQNFVDPVQRWSDGLASRNEKLEIYHVDDPFREIEDFKLPKEDDFFGVYGRKNEALRVPNWFEMYPHTVIAAQAEVSRRASEVVLCDRSDRFLVSASLPKMETWIGNLSGEHGYANENISLSFEGFDGRLSYPRHTHASGWGTTQAPNKTNFEAFKRNVGKDIQPVVKLDIFKYSEQVQSMKLAVAPKDGASRLDDDLNVKIWADPAWKPAISQPFDLKILLAEELTPGIQYPLMRGYFPNPLYRLERLLSGERWRGGQEPIKSDKKQAFEHYRASHANKDVPAGGKPVSEMNDAELEYLIASELLKHIADIEKKANAVIKDVEVDVGEFRKLTEMIRDFRTDPSWKGIMLGHEAVLAPLDIFEKALALHEHELQSRMSAAEPSAAPQPGI